MLHGQYDGSLLNGDSLRPVAHLRLCKHARVKIYTLKLLIESTYSTHNSFKG